MKQKQFTQCGIIIIVSMGSLFAWSIMSGNTVVPIIAVIIGTVALYLCKSRVEEVIVDERTYKIGEQAARRTLQVFSIVSGVTGILLVVLSQYGYPEVTQVGLTLAYSSCALLVLYSLFYRYYNKKYGI